MWIEETDLLVVKLNRMYDHPVHADHDTALGIAVFSRTEIVGLLLAHGADVHVGNDHALHAAGANALTDTCKLLLANGADPVRAFPAGTRLDDKAAPTLDAALTQTQSEHMAKFRDAHPDDALPLITAHLAAHDVRASLERPARGPCPTPAAPRRHATPRVSVSDDLDH